MRALSALLGLILFVSCFSENFALNPETSIVVVGSGECGDCKKFKIPNVHAFTGLRVNIDCKVSNGEFKTRGSGELDKNGNFNVQLPNGLINTNGELVEECFANLFGASNNPCPSSNGLSKLSFKKKDNQKHIFTAPKLSFSASLCPSAFLYKSGFGKLPFGKLPFGKLPFGKLPFGKLPFGKLPYGKLPPFGFHHHFYPPYSKPSPLPPPPYKYPSPSPPPPYIYPTPSPPPPYTYPTPPYSYPTPPSPYYVPPSPKLDYPPPSPYYPPPTPVYPPPTPVYPPPTPVYPPPTPVYPPPTPVYPPPTPYYPPPTPYYPPPTYKPPTYKSPSPPYRPPAYKPPSYKPPAPKYTPPPYSPPYDH